MIKKHHILYLLALTLVLIVGGSLIYKPNKNAVLEQNNFKVGDVIDGWKVVTAAKNERIGGTLYDSYVMLEGEIKSVVKYSNSTGDSGVYFMIYFPDEAKIPVKLRGSWAWITDKNFPYDIADGSYGTMEVIINKIKKIEAAIDSDSDGFYISKILGFNELGRAEILYDDNDEVRTQKQDEELSNFLSSKSFEIKPTLPFSVLSLVKSANIEEVKKLISTYGINYKDALGDTLLHIALKTNSLPAINFLLDQSEIDLNAKNVLGQTPSHIAAMNGQLDNLKLLISKGADVKAVDRYQNNLLHIAAKTNRLEIIKYLLDNDYIDVDEKNAFDKTPLFYSSEYHSTKALIDKGAKLSELPYGGRKLTEIAVHQKNKEFVELLLSNNPEIRAKIPAFHNTDKKDLVFAQFLLDKGFDINLTNGGRSALFDAVFINGGKDFAEFLLKNGIDPNLQSKNGDTALHEAALFTKNDNIKLLLDYGANPSIKNNKGLTPLDVIKNKIENIPLEKEDAEIKQRTIDILEKATSKSNNSF
jgi:ankyrin repeat protein